MPRVPSGLLLHLLFALPWIGACSHAEEPRPQEPFTIGVVTWVGSGPFYLARDQGLFDDLKVDIRIIDDTAGRRAALARGAIVAMAATVDDFANGAAAGLPGVAVLKTDDSFGGDGIVVSPEIKSVTDLKGRTIAFPQGMPSHFFLLHTLEHSGLSIRDLKVSYMEAGEAGAAFVAGKVDAAVTWQPWLSKAAQRKGGGTLLRSTRDAPGLISDIVVANRGALAARRADFLKFVRGWYAAVAYAQGKHSDEAARSMAKSLHLALPEWQLDSAGIRLADRAENLRFFGGQGPGNRFTTLFSEAGVIWQAQGLVTKAAAPHEFVDPTLVAEAR